MARIMGNHEKLLSPAAMADFFGEVYWRFGPKGLDAKQSLMISGSEAAKRIFPTAQLVRNFA